MTKSRSSSGSNPERVLSYTTKSLRKIERELKSLGINISHKTISKILASMNYSKQANVKMLQVGKPHSDRNAQFEHINNTAAGYIKMGVPVISVDTKNKEKIGSRSSSGIFQFFHRSTYCFSRTTELFRSFFIEIVRISVNVKQQIARFSWISPSPYFWRIFQCPGVF